MCPQKQSLKKIEHTIPSIPIRKPVLSKWDKASDDIHPFQLLTEGRLNEQDTCKFAAYMELLDRSVEIFGEQEEELWFGQSASDVAKYVHLGNPPFFVHADAVVIRRTYEIVAHNFFPFHRFTPP